MTLADLVGKTVEWCSENGMSESRFATDSPRHFVYTFDLFDFLAECAGIHKSEIGKRFNRKQEEIEKRQQIKNRMAQGEQESTETGEGGGTEG